MAHLKIAASAVVAILMLASQNVAAQATGGVFSPVVKDGHRSLQYRSAYDPDSYAFAQRLHYQQAIDGTFMWRVIAQARKTADSDLDYDFVQGELFWDLTEDDSADWQTGVRFDVRVPDEGRPAIIGANWMNQFTLSNDWQARLVVLSAFEVGSDARDGVLLQTRANIWKALPDRTTYGVELFSVYGGTSDIVGFDDDQHAIGPFMTVALSDTWAMFAGALFALDGDAPDSNLRLWLGRRF